MPRARQIFFAAMLTPSVNIGHSVDPGLTMRGYRLLPSRPAPGAALAASGAGATKTIGDADQIAATHLFLMENRFVTGAVLTVDGGFVLTGT